MELTTNVCLLRGGWSLASAANVSALLTYLTLLAHVGVLNEGGLMYLVHPDSSTLGCAVDFSWDVIDGVLGCLLGAFECARHILDEFRCGDAVHVWFHCCLSSNGVDVLTVGHLEAVEINNNCVVN